MILLEEHLVAPTERTEDLLQALREVLDLRWSSYRKALKHCRRKFSEKTVHALRVEIRRMQSMLLLLGTALPPNTVLPLQCELKARLKALSRLRDTHVQIDALAELLHDQPELKPLHDWLRRKERRLTKRLERALTEAHTGKATRRILQLDRALRALAENRNLEASLEETLLGAVARSFGDVTKHHRRLAATNIAAIHQMRVAFKRFRYMVEALARVLPGITQPQLRAMQAYQSRMGGIQDAEVLLQRAEKFARKGKLDKNAFRAFRDNMLRRRTRLIKGFLASADRLLAFWPPRSRKISQTRRSHGIVYSPARHRG